MTPQHVDLQFRNLLPVAREPLNFQGPRALDPFELKLLKIQRGAQGLNTLSTSSEVQQQSRDLESLSPPKRPKWGHVQDVDMDTSEEDAKLQTLVRPAQPQRKNSAYYQVRPDWSPISRRNSEVSIPQISSESSGSGSPSMAVPPVDAQSAGLTAAPSEALMSIAPTRPRSPAQPATQYAKPSVAETGSPMSVSWFSREKGSAKIPSTSFPVTEPAKSLRRLSDTRRTPHVGGGYSDLKSAKVNPLHAQASSDALLSSPTRPVADFQAGPESLSAIHRVEHFAASPSSSSDAEQNQVDVLLSSFQRKTDSEAFGTKIADPGPDLHSMTTSKSEKVAKQGLRGLLKVQNTYNAYRDSIKPARATKESNAADTESGAPHKPTGPARGLKRGFYKKTLAKMNAEAAAATAATAAGLTIVGISTKQTSVSDNTAREDTMRLERDGPSLSTQAANQVSGSVSDAEDTATQEDVLKLSFNTTEKTTDNIPAVHQDKKIPGAALIAAADKAGSENLVASAKKTTSQPGTPKSLPKVKKIVSEDEDYGETGSVMSESVTSDSSIDPITEQIATLKGNIKKIAARKTQANLAMVNETGSKKAKSTSTNQNTGPNPSQTTVQESTPVKKKGSSRPAASAIMDGYTSSSVSKEFIPKPKDTAVKIGKIVPPKKSTPEPKEPSIKKETSIATKKKATTKSNEKSVEPRSAALRRQKSESLNRELSKLSDKPKPRLRGFRGNQWTNADGSPRLNANGTSKVWTPRAKKQEGVDE